MKYKQNRLLLIAIITLLLMIYINDKNIRAESNQSVGFDFSETPLSEDFYTCLDGQWHFFEGKLFTHAEVKKQLTNGERGKIVSVPSSFEKLTGEINYFGTYSTTVKVPKKYIGEMLAIHIPYQYSAYAFYIDETEVAKNGEVGVDSASHSAEMAPRTAYFTPESDEVLLTMQLSSFDHIRGGFENTIHYGGTIKVDSVLGEGSVFTFTLPLAGASFTEETAATTVPSMNIDQLPIKETPFAMNHAMVQAFTKHTPTTHKPRILAVDDDPVNLQVLTNILAEEQYEVETATSGKAALKRLDHADWDLVISDVMMPQMSGYDLTRSIREDFSIAELPILLLTARSNSEDIYTGFLAGANDYVKNQLMR